jgi:phosphatidyl-myo-inositol dimannoside synthase
MTKRDAQSVLIITRNMPPLWGGMEQLNWHIADELVSRASVRMVAPTGTGKSAPPGVEILEVPLKPLWSFLLGAFFKAIWSVLRQRPDVVLAGSGLTAPIAWLAARISGARSVVYVHGLDVALANKLYTYLWVPFLRRMNAVVANSRATAQLARQIGIASGKIEIIHPGVVVSDKPNDRNFSISVRKEKMWGSRPLLLSVGRLTSRKGLREFVAGVLPKIALRHPDVLLVVVGDAPTDSLHAQVQTVESIKLAASNAGVAENLEFLGVIVDRNQLAAIYETVDVHVFPVRDIPNDPEGFGMVAIEAAAHGVPTVAYASGGTVDAVAEGVSGYLRTAGDADGFANAVLHILSHPLPEDGVRAFAGRFNWKNFGDRISRILLQNHV